jgi:hypothetical protein
MRDQAATVERRSYASAATRKRLEGLQTGPAEMTWHEAVLDRRSG